MVFTSILDFRHICFSSKPLAYPTRKILPYTNTAATTTTTTTAGKEHWSSETIGTTWNLDSTPVVSVIKHITGKLIGFLLLLLFILKSIQMLLNSGLYLDNEINKSAFGKIIILFHLNGWTESRFFFYFLTFTVVTS